MEQIYKDLEVIFNDTRDLLYAIGKYNPGIEATEKEDLSVLSDRMGNIAARFKKLQITMQNKDGVKLSEV